MLNSCDDFINGRAKWVRISLRFGMRVKSRPPRVRQINRHFHEVFRRQSQKHRLHSHRLEALRHSSSSPGQALIVMKYLHLVCVSSIFLLLALESVCHGSERKLIDDLRYIDDNHTQNKVRCVGWEEDGKRFGKWLFYYPNGVICLISTYNSDGNQDGQFLEFYESGVLGVCGQFENGKESGIWVGWHENAKIRYIANYGGGDLGKVSPPIMEWFNEEGVPKKQGIKGVVDSLEKNLKAQASGK